MRRQALKGSGRRSEPGGSRLARTWNGSPRDSPYDRSCSLALLKASVQTSALLSDRDDSGSFATGKRCKQNHCVGTIPHPGCDRRTFIDRRANRDREGLGISSSDCQSSGNASQRRITARQLHRGLICRGRLEGQGDFSLSRGLGDVGHRKVKVWRGSGTHSQWLSLASRTDEAAPGAHA